MKRPDMAFHPVDGPWVTGGYLTENFTKRELECQHCHRLPDTEAFLAFIRKLQRARDIADVPFVVLSGYRCAFHNTRVGGAEDSSHLIAVAADIECLDMATREKIFRGAIQAGFRRIGIGPRALHFDDDYRKPTAIWLYRDGREI